LDSQGTHSTFHDAELIENIRDAIRPLRMKTNVGVIIYNKQADVPNYGMVWFNPNSIANIISMSEAERRGHKIFYSPGLFKLISKDRNLEIAFQMKDVGVYAYSVSFEGLSHVQTIEENGQFFSQRQIALLFWENLLGKLIMRDVDQVRCENYITFG
jgi:hypothetical protein